MNKVKEYLEEKEDYIDDWQIRDKKDCHPSSVIKIYEEKDALKALEIQRQEFIEILEKMDEQLKGYACGYHKKLHNFIANQIKKLKRMK